MGVWEFRGGGALVRDCREGLYDFATSSRCDAYLSVSSPITLSSLLSSSPSPPSDESKGVSSLTFLRGGGGG